MDVVAHSCCWLAFLLSQLSAYIPAPHFPSVVIIPQHHQAAHAWYLIMHLGVVELKPIPVPLLPVSCMVVLRGL